MHYNVPQFIDIEDRIVGPLTAKQILWLFGLAATLFLIWIFLQDKATFIIVSIPVSLLFLALAFYRPYGQPLSKFLTSIFVFFVKPKIYLWKRGTERKEAKKIEKKDKVIVKRKSFHEKEIYDLAKILDSEVDILDEINKKD